MSRFTRWSDFKQSKLTGEGANCKVYRAYYDENCGKKSDDGDSSPLSNKSQINIYAVKVFHHKSVSFILSLELNCV